VTSQFLTFLRFEVFTAVNMKNAVFWDVTPCGSCKNRLWEDRITSIISDKNRQARGIAVKPISVNLIMEAILSSKTSVLTTATWRNIPEDGILLPCFFSPPF
jgi:hypothetical protein